MPAANLNRIRDLSATARNLRQDGSPVRLIDQEAVTSPDATVDLERIQELNATMRDFPRNATLARLFEEQVAKTPGAVAVRSGTTALCYRELDARANQLAHALHRRGVRRGSLVGVCVERGPDMIATVLAVLKAGAAYVPLDPAFPAHRLSFMVEDASLTLIVSEAALADTHGGRTDCVLELDTHNDEIAVQSAVGFWDLDRQATAGDVAYVLYTSGSTGKPKGVQVQHGAAVNFLTSMLREPGLRPSDRVLAVTTLSFDIALLELFLPLSVGAEIILASRDEARDGHALRRLIEESNVTLAQATPATWRMLIDAGWAGNSALRALCGGEALKPDLAAELLSRVGELWNMYGPTETTVWSTCFRVKNLDLGMPIGRPIANTSVWILNEEGQPCPLDAVGEIHIGGAGVALGYLNRPELTSERFVPDPFSNVVGARLYKTGDLGRWRPDGYLEWMGRKDFQVKIRGHRIELAEIEATIVEHGWLKEVVVVPRETPSGETRLIAYGIEGGKRTSNEQEQLEFASQRLPSYMVPFHVVVVEAFPLTPNGKLDRNALPEPSFERDGNAVVAPRTPVEETLSAVFREVLCLGAVGIDDNFFDLGGSSLQTIQVVDRLNERGLSVPPAHMFRFPTIRSLATAVSARVASGGDEEALGAVLVLQDRGTRPPLFLLHTTPGDLLGYGDLVHALGPEQPVYGFHGLGSYSDDIREISDLAELYAGRLMAFKPTGTIHLAGWCFGGTIAFELARVLRRRGRTVGFVGLLEANPSRSRLSNNVHMVRALLTGKTVKRPSLRSLVRRVLRLEPVNGDGGEAKTFALEIAAGPFANRARNYARNRAATERHRTQHYGGMVHVVRGVLDDRVAVEDDFGWSDFADRVRVLTVQSTHDGLLRPPYCAEVAEFIRAAINVAERS